MVVVNKSGDRRVADNVTIPIIRKNSYTLLVSLIKFQISNSYAFSLNFFFNFQLIRKTKLNHVNKSCSKFITSNKIQKSFMSEKIPAKSSKIRI